MRAQLLALCLVGSLVSTAPVRAQSVDHDSAVAVVTRLFDAMRMRDTASMRAAFAPGATLQSVTPTGVQADAIEAWITSVARAPAGVLLDERLGEAIVQVSGELATIWVDYWFFAGERFSHCGVDAFILARTGGPLSNWRIVSVADTRQRDGCRPAPGP